MMYNKLVEDCFFHPSHVGELDINEPLTGHHERNMRHQNATIAIKLYIQCTHAGLIHRACFKAIGNPYVIAALEWLCRQIEGFSLDKLPPINYQILISVLEIPTSQYPVALIIEGIYKEVLALINKKIMGYEL